MRNRTVVIGIILGILFISQPLNANIAVVNIDSDDASGRKLPLGLTEGWQFTTVDTISVTHLGMWDDYFMVEPPAEIGLLENSYGFQYEIPIGIWRVSDQSLVAYTTIGPGIGDLLEDEFRYVEIDPVTLAKDETYVIGFQWHTSSLLCDWVRSLKVDEFSVDPSIIFGPGMYNPEAGFLYPDTPDAWQRSHA